jgi:nitrous oxidase accessory protein NosD
LSVKPEVWARQRLPLVQNLEIEGAHAEADGLELRGTMQSVISGVLIRQCRHGVHLIERNRNVLISACHIYHNTGVGIFLDRLNLHQINIVGSHISYNRLGGIRIEASEIRNLQITGNDIEYNNHRAFGTDPEPTAEIHIDTTAPNASVNEVAIASNTIQATDSPGGANIRIHNKPDDGRPPGLITITGNVIGSQENNVHLTGCYGVILSGNTIYSCTNRNLHLEQCRQIVMNGNYFRRHTPEYQTGVRFVDSSDCVFQGAIMHDETDAGQASGASLLELSGCRRINISGSQFLNGAPFGIDVENSEHVQITGCSVSETRDTPAAKGSIRFRGKGKSNRIAHCDLDAGNAEPGTDLAAESHVKMSD